MSKLQCLRCDHLDLEQQRNDDGKAVIVAVCTGNYNPWQLPLSMQGEECDIHRRQTR